MVLLLDTYHVTVVVKKSGQPLLELANRWVIGRPGIDFDIHIMRKVSGKADQGSATVLVSAEQCSVDSVQ